MTPSPPGEGRRQFAAARIGAVDPRVRLSVRDSQLVAAVPVAELLVRVADLGDSLRPRRERTGDGDLARARTLSNGLDCDFGRTLAFAQARTLGDLDLDVAGDLLDASATAQTLAAALDTSLIFGGLRGLTPRPALALVGILDQARARDQHHSGQLRAAADHARALISVLDDPYGLDRSHTAHYLSALREELNGVLGLAGDLDRARDLARSLDSPRRTISADHRWAALDLGGRLSRALDHALPWVRFRNPAWDQARALARGLTRDLDPPLGFVRRRASGRARARALASILAGALTGALGLPRLDGLVDALLDGALDDFRQADLRGTSLTDGVLTGVRWPVPGTRWPLGVPVEALIRRSAETHRAPAPTSSRAAHRRQATSRCDTPCDEPRVNPPRAALRRLTEHQALDPRKSASWDPRVRIS